MRYYAALPVLAALAAVPDCYKVISQEQILDIQPVLYPFTKG